MNLSESQILDRFDNQGWTVDDLSVACECTATTINLILHRNGRDLTGKKLPARSPSLIAAGRTKSSETRSSAGALARFKPYKAAPKLVHGLAEDHKAIVEGRTLFPGNVVGPMDSPRMLVSGKNNAKVGLKVLKGPWAGMPIFTLTLEERATCPKACHMLFSVLRQRDAMAAAQRCAP